MIPRAFLQQYLPSFLQGLLFGIRPGMSPQNASEIRSGGIPPALPNILTELPETKVEMMERISVIRGPTPVF